MLLLGLCYLHFSLNFSFALCHQQNKPQPSTTTFVLNQLNHLPSLGAVVTKQSATNNIKHTITVTKVVHVPNSSLRGSSTSSTSIASSASTVVPSTRSDQVLSVCSKKWQSQLVKDRNKETLLFIINFFVMCLFLSFVCLFVFEADSVERPPSDQHCEELWSEGREPDGANEAKASPEHHYTSSNSNWNR